MDQGGAGGGHAHGHPLAQSGGEAQVRESWSCYPDFRTAVSWTGGWWTCMRGRCGQWTPRMASWSGRMPRQTTSPVRCLVIVNMIILFILDGHGVHIFHECPNFKLYNLQDRPSSFAVQNGGWVIYEKPNYKVFLG